MNPQLVEKPFQFTLRTLLLGTAVFALVMGLTVSFKMPEIFATALVAFMAWLTWRIAKVNIVAIILWFLATELMFILEYFGRTAIGYEKLKWLLMVLLLSISIFLTSCIMFFYSGIMTNKKIGNIVCAFLVILTPFIIFPCINGIGQIIDVYESAENAPIMQSIVDDVETIHNRLGRVPNDQNELINLLKKPLPCIHLRSQNLSMHYECVDSDNYMIWFQNFTDVGNVYIFTYDSQKPKCGWIRTGN